MRTFTSAFQNLLHAGPLLREASPCGNLKVLAVPELSAADVPEGN
jgi:hypothetical protein